MKERLKNRLPGKRSLIPSRAVRILSWPAVKPEIANSNTDAGQFALGFQFGMVGPAVGAGVSSYLSASAARTVADAEAALEQKRKLARDMDSRLEEIEIDLRFFLVEQKGMVSKRELHRRSESEI